VQFLDNGNFIGTGTLSAGTESFTTGSLTTGTHSDHGDIYGRRE
jgi:hypothetical protein